MIQTQLHSRDGQIRAILPLDANVIRGILVKAREADRTTVQRRHLISPARPTGEAHRQLTAVFSCCKTNSMYVRLPRGKAQYSCLSVSYEHPILINQTLSRPLSPHLVLRASSHASLDARSSRTRTRPTACISRPLPPRATCRASRGSGLGDSLLSRHEALGLLVDPSSRPLALCYSNASMGA